LRHPKSPNKQTEGQCRPFDYVLWCGECCAIGFVGYDDRTADGHIIGPISIRALTGSVLKRTVVGHYLFILRLTPSVSSWTEAVVRFERQAAGVLSRRHQPSRVRVATGRYRTGCRSSLRPVREYSESRNRESRRTRR